MRRTLLYIGIPLLLFVAFLSYAQAQASRGQQARQGGQSYRKEPLNRAEFLTIVLGKQFQNLPSKECFNDVKAGTWYSKFVCKGQELGLTSGYGDGSFRPGSSITLGQALIVLQRAYNLQLPPALQAKIATKLGPLNMPLTRAQMAQLLARLPKNKMLAFGSPSGQITVPTSPRPPTSPASTTPVTSTTSSNSGTCETLGAGENTIMAAGQQRSFVLQLPSNPNGAPVVFVWHAHGGTPERALNGMGASGQRNASILVAPAAIPTATADWALGSDSSSNNRDLALFDTVLSCLKTRYAIDANRISTLGFSAGALWSTFLTMYRADQLASAVILSGGLSGTYHQPASSIPVLLAWGGASDTAGGQFPFESATLEFSKDLRANGHFVVECNHNSGHKPPSDSNFLWEFIAAHPKGVSPEPYASGLPSDFPSYCVIPG